MMPFGIQLKGFIIGLLMAYLVIPWVQRLILTRTAKAAPS
jgi:antibiotic biosynthesis monooxygenase (ABM) superfamily enzyme